MKQTMNPQRSFAVIAAGIALSATVLAQTAAPPGAIRALPTPPAEGGVAGPGSYATSFEAEEGFTLAYIGGNGTPAWGAFAGSSQQPAVDDTNPADGAQHLRIAKDPAVSANVFIAGFSPSMPAAPGPATFSIEVAISATGGAAYDVVLQAPSQGMLAARVRFDAQGNLLVFDNPGTFLQFIDTGADWSPGVYRTLAVCLDPDLDRLDYYYDGVHVYSSLTGLIGASAIEQIILTSNNSQAGDHADFDEIRLQPGLHCIPGDGPANDLCDDALSLALGTTTFETSGAATDGPAVDCGVGGQITNDVWYTYTADCTGDLAVGTCGTADFDTRIAVYLGPPCDASAATLLACNDDAPDCPGAGSRVIATVAEGQQYTVRVGGSGPADEGSGEFEVGFAPQLSVETAPAPAGYAAGETVAVELRMTGLCQRSAAGYQAFLEYDPLQLAFDGGAYTDAPFGQHILAPITGFGNGIDLAAGINQLAGQQPTLDPALLATLYFTALEPLCRADIAFRSSLPPSRLTDPLGVEIAPLQLRDGITCPADVNGDARVDVDDLIAIILAWNGLDCRADVNADMAVDVDDLITVILAWGPCG